MAASNALYGYGAILQIGDGAGSESFTDILEITNITGPDGEIEMLEATHMESPSARAEKKAGIFDEGEVTMTGSYVPGDATQKLLRTDQASRTERNFKVIDPDTAATTASFAAFVQRVGRVRPVKGLMELTVTLAITGAVTWTSS